MSDILKGNYKVNKEIKSHKETEVEPEEEKPEKLKSSKEIATALKKAAMNSIGGSMVYVDNSDLTWDPNEEDKK